MVSRNQAQSESKRAVRPQEEMNTKARASQQKQLPSPACHELRLGKNFKDGKDQISLQPVGNAQSPLLKIQLSRKNFKTEYFL